MKNVPDSCKRHHLFTELFSQHRVFMTQTKWCSETEVRLRTGGVLLSPDANLISLLAAGCTLTQRVQKTAAAPTNSSTEKPRCSLQKNKWTFYCHTFVISLAALAFIRNTSASSSQHWTVTKTKHFFLSCKHLGLLGVYWPDGQQSWAQFGCDEDLQWETGTHAGRQSGNISGCNLGWM